MEATKRDGTVHDNTTYIETAIQRKTNAWKTLIKILKTATKRRINELMEKVEDATATRDNTKTTAYKKVKEKEKHSDGWKEIRRTLNRGIGDPILNITIPGATRITKTGAKLTNLDRIITTK